MKATIIRRFLNFSLLLILIFPVTANAYDLGIRPSTLAWGDDVILSAPSLYFRDELHRLRPFLNPEFTHIDILWPVDEYVSLNDKEELESGLRKMGYERKKIKGILKEYTDVRSALGPYHEELTYFRYNNQKRWNRGDEYIESPAEYWKQEGKKFREDKPDIYKDLDKLEVPDGLPPEFDLYIRGAIAYHGGKWLKAEKHWKELLNLPPGERHFRTTWATYMLGKTHLVKDPAKASVYFSDVRDQASEGFSDSLGLASSSYLWQARAEYRQQNYETALILYATSDAAGDRGINIPMSRVIRDWCTSADGNYESFLADPVLRKLITIYACSTTYSYRVHLEKDEKETWINAIDDYWMEDVELAEIVAWESYKLGNYEIAQLWLERCPDNTPLIPWLDAMLKMRRKEFREAQDILQRIYNRIPEVDLFKWYWIKYESIPGLGDCRFNPIRVKAQLALLHFQRMHFVEAMDLYLRNWHWRDAAYIAERVMTVDKLIEFVDDRLPAISEIQIRSDWDSQERDQMVSSLRYLLARRLIRLGRYSDALEYLPEELHPYLLRYKNGLIVGASEIHTRSERVSGFWNAAEMLKEHGMELMGTELAPDWTVKRGNYNPPNRIIEARSEFDETSLFPSTAYERLRLYRTSEETLPYKRFHYRYKALDLYWEAIELMPDNTNATAEKIWEAGNWMKLFDPQAADRFYKALVNRCPDTALGQEADELRWFPKYIELGC